MDDVYLAGIDIGTTSICVLLTEASTGRVVHSTTLPNNTEVRCAAQGNPLASGASRGGSGAAALRQADPPGGRHCQDPEAVWRIVEAALKELQPWEAEIGAYGISGQMHGILYVDAEGEAVSPLYTWLDRSGEWSDGNTTYASRLAEETGYPAFSGYGAVTHYVHSRLGTVPQGAAGFCTIGDYVAGKLASWRSPGSSDGRGHERLIDATNAHSIGLFDLAAERFDESAIRKAGMDPALFPKTAPIRSVEGLAGGRIPVCRAIGDNQASFLGTVPSLRDTLLVNIGTGSQLSAYAPREWMRDAAAGPSFLTESTSRGVEIRPFPDGGYLLVAAALSGGKSYALLERLFQEICRSFAGDGEREIYSRMNALAETALQAERQPLLKVNTQFYGTRQNPSATGSITGITAENFTAGQLIAGTLRGMARELYEDYEAFPAGIRLAMSRLMGSGNAVRRNPALGSILSQVFGLPLELPQHAEEAAYGAVLHARATLANYRKGR